MTAITKPNVIFVFGDQWRAQAFGYAGDPNAQTPTIDRLANESVNFTNAVSGCPVCTPYRASFLTGRFPTTHGLFMNDVCLSNDAVSIAQAFTAGGYDTAYIGKWHVDGHGRTRFIPRHRRQGFDYWKVLECTHDYNHSLYYGDTDQQQQWQGYDAFAQTQDALHYIDNHDRDNPFLMVLSWGPPHEPYETAPEKYRQRFSPDTIQLRDNVPPECADQARQELAGYYAHGAALDDCLKLLLDHLEQSGIADNTLLVFTSDHGDMIGSQGHTKKQRPWDESIRVPFLLRYPNRLGRTARQDDRLIDAQDIMPTLLGLCDLPIPDTVEGYDFSAYLQGRQPAPAENIALINCVTPFGQYNRLQHGGKEYRGLRTPQYTYVRDLTGPWLLYDNLNDPYQLHNRCNDPDLADIQNQLDQSLSRELARRHDEFLPGQVYIDRWGYTVDQTGTVPYH